VTYRVRFSDEALQQIVAMRRWWVDQALGPPVGFDDDLIAAIHRLEGLPHSAPPYPPLDGVRRILLRRARLHMYFAVDDQARTVEILAVWHTSRGTRPL
jgi:plasmid stabilization system protein ParE